MSGTYKKTGWHSNDINRRSETTTSNACDKDWSAFKRDHSTQRNPYEWCMQRRLIHIQRSSFYATHPQRVEHATKTHSHSKVPAMDITNQIVLLNNEAVIRTL